MCICVHVHMCACTYVCMYICVYVHMCVCAYVCAYVCMCICMCICMCMNVYIFVYVCIIICVCVQSVSICALLCCVHVWCACLCRCMHVYVCVHVCIVCASEQHCVWTSVCGVGSLCIPSNSIEFEKQQIFYQPPAA